MGRACRRFSALRHTGLYDGGFDRIKLGRDMESRETERLELVVAQGLLGQWIP